MQEYREQYYSVILFALTINTAEDCRHIFTISSEECFALQVVD